MCFGAEEGLDWTGDWTQRERRGGLGGELGGSGGMSLLVIGRQLFLVDNLKKSHLR